MTNDELDDVGILSVLKRLQDAGHLHQDDRDQLVYVLKSDWGREEARFISPTVNQFADLIKTFDDKNNVLINILPWIGSKDEIRVNFVFTRYQDGDAKLLPQIVIALDDIIDKLRK